MRVSCWFRGKKKGRTFQYRSKERHMPYLYGCDDFLYTSEDYFGLDQDFPEAKEAPFSELVFEFKAFYKNWKVKACGVQLWRTKKNLDVLRMKMMKLLVVIMMGLRRI
ncbi:unnamed protein product [Brassica oleracea var. botrytis]